MDVGVRELRDGLSRHLAEVQSGHIVTITDHGRPIARIIPIAGQSKLDKLRSEGRIQPATKRKTVTPRPIKSKGLVSDLIAEQRR